MNDPIQAALIGIGSFWTVTTILMIFYVITCICTKQKEVSGWGSLVYLLSSVVFVVSATALFIDGPYVAGLAGVQVSQEKQVRDDFDGRRQEFEERRREMTGYDDQQRQRSGPGFRGGDRPDGERPDLGQRPSRDGIRSYATGDGPSELRDADTNRPLGQRPSSGFRGGGRGDGERRGPGPRVYGPPQAEKDPA